MCEEIFEAHNLMSINSSFDGYRGKIAIQLSNTGRPAGEAQKASLPRQLSGEPRSSSAFRRLQC